MKCALCQRRIKNPKRETRETRTCYRCRKKYPNYSKTIKGLTRIEV